MAAAGQLPQEDIVKRLTDNLECSICLEQYKDPRVLHCQHSYCAQCLKQHVGEAAVIRCPLCNDESDVPEGGIDGLKSNFFIRGLIDDVIGKTSECPKALKPKCGSCEEGNDAISHCDDCDCGLCGDCVCLHQKLKALRLHQVTPLPTEEELLEDMKVASDAMIEKITRDIHDKETALNKKISQLQKKVKGIEADGDKALTKLSESHKALLLKIDAYMEEMSTTVKKNTAVRLGDMPKELAAYQQQLRDYKTLKQQGWMINNIQIHKRIGRCKELMQQMSEYQPKHRGVWYQGGRHDVPVTKYEAGETDANFTSILRMGLGYLTPLPKRLSRNVQIIKQKEITAEKRDGLLSILHDALDSVNKYPTFSDPYGDTITEIRKVIRKKLEQKYPSGMWSIIVGSGFVYDAYVNNLLTLTIDGIKFVMFTPYAKKKSK